MAKGRGGEGARGEWAPGGVEEGMAGGAHGLPEAGTVVAVTGPGQRLHRRD